MSTGNYHFQVGNFDKVGKVKVRISLETVEKLEIH